MNQAPILEVRGFSAGYGKVTALHEASLKVDTGSIVTVIGPNGAGKSTLLNAIMGVIRSSGEVYFDGHSLERKNVEARVMDGLSLVPEQRALFADMSVLDNLQLGSFRRHRARETKPMDQLDWVFSLFPRLKERASQLAGTLSGGERQMLAVGRALMGKPRLLMLDEPSLGLAPRVVKEVLDVVGGLREHGVSTLLIEQNARAALKLANYGYVLENGRIVLEGPAHELAENPRIAQSYLGISNASRPARTESAN
jgi:branched-chain amino acid transport system ATP-binding protein